MTTEIQKPAEGILMRSPTWVDDIPNSFHIECDCISAEHAVEAWIDIERETADDDYVLLSFYVNCYTPWRKVERFWDRVKFAAKILFTGNFSLEHSLILRDQAALNVAEAIRSTVVAHQEVMAIRHKGGIGSSHN